jgi:hypothetical protein
MSEPVVFAREGAVYANSLDVAAVFGKRHDHVLRSVDYLIASIVAPKMGGQSPEPTEDPIVPSKLRERLVGEQGGVMTCVGASVLCFIPASGRSRRARAAPAWGAPTT